MNNVTHKFLSMYLFLFLTLYLFRARRAHHQERQIVSIQPLVTVNLCWWLCCVQVGSFTPNLHTYRKTVYDGNVWVEWYSLALIVLPCLKTSSIILRKKQGYKRLNTIVSDWSTDTKQVSSMQKKETFPSLSLTISQIFCIHESNEVKASR